MYSNSIAVSPFVLALLCRKRYRLINATPSMYIGAVLPVKHICTDETGTRMPKLSLQSLGRLALDRRGRRGIRETAAEMGISAATLSRVERGFMPDLETFGKICKWLKIDPGSVLGIEPTQVNQQSQLSVHFRKDQVIAIETAQALAQMILAAQRALMQSENGG
jgi:transcriptional regulator with XRE-family HTH domain